MALWTAQDAALLHERQTVFRLFLERVVEPLVRPYWKDADFATLVAERTKQPPTPYAVISKMLGGRHSPHALKVSAPV